jgi:glutamyl-tRNA reductase
VDLAQLVDVLARADVAIFATGAPHPLVDADRLASVSAAPDLLVLDLCVPRNVDPAVRGIPGVDLVDLADLRAQGRAECESVAHDLLSAEGIIAEEVDRYVRWLAGRSAVAPLRRLRADVEAAVTHRVAAAMHDVPEDMRPAVEERVRRELHELAHGPTSRLLEAAVAGDHRLVDQLSMSFAAAASG